MSKDKDLEQIIGQYSITSGKELLHMFIRAAGFAAGSYVVKVIHKKGKEKFEELKKRKQKNRKEEYSKDGFRIKDVYKHEGEEIRVDYFYNISDSCETLGVMKEYQGKPCHIVIVKEDKQLKSVHINAVEQDISERLVLSENERVFQKAYDSLDIDKCYQKWKMENQNKITIK